MQGTVKFYDSNRGYGFLAGDAGGADMFVHVSQVADGITLREGDRVAFEVGTSERTGKSEARRVTIVA